MSYFLSIFIGTLILEDVALVTSLTLVGQGKLSFEAAFLACFLGICVGDLGLYFFGVLVARLRLEDRFKFLHKHRPVLQKMQSQMRESKLIGYSVVISRLLPGTRIPIYFGAGFVGYSFWWFLWLTLTSVFAWVFLVLVAGRYLQILFGDHWLWAIAVIAVLFLFLKSLMPKLVSPWERRALAHSWRRYLYFEFWPAGLFYVPIVPYYLFLSIKYRSVFTPFYISPNLDHGGLIGESKWEFLRHLDPQAPHTLSARLIAGSHEPMNDLLKQNQDMQIEFPFVLKPDVGQRGFAVRIIRNPQQLKEYLELCNFNLVAQKLSQYPNEAGLFYVRKPSENSGRLISITDKKFPFVIGDGVAPLGELILKDPRARIIASTYFARHADQLDRTPERGEVVRLSECGNHCQGAIFRNGKNLYSEKLVEVLDQLAKQVPHFYFGRFDIRYESAESLKEGKGFEIVEINGAGSEATHIWDESTPLLEAYQTLFRQWDLAFAIGAEVRALGLPDRKAIRPFAFLMECARVRFRPSGNLSTSS